jgi:hypothetical protein
MTAPVTTAPAAASPVPTQTINNYYNDDRGGDDDDNDDGGSDGVQLHMNRARMLTLGMSLVGGVLSLVAMIGAVWAYSYKANAPTNAAEGTLDITQSSTVTSGNSSNQSTTVVIGSGTTLGGGNTNSVSYTVPVRTDRTSLFFWTMAAILGAAFLILLGAAAYFRPHSSLRRLVPTTP